MLKCETCVSTVVFCISIGTIIVLIIVTIIPTRITFIQL